MSVASKSREDVSDGRGRVSTLTFGRKVLRQGLLASACYPSLLFGP